jgi:hypothetical protein
MLFSVQGLNAQTKLEINKIASVKAIELRQSLKFNETQLEEVYQAYKAYEQTHQKISTDLVANAETKKKLDLTFDAKMKEILSAKQYDLYKNL